MLVMVLQGSTEECDWQLHLEKPVDFFMGFGGRGNYLAAKQADPSCLFFLNRGGLIYLCFLQFHF